MSLQDTRWIQRFNNYKKVLSQLNEAIELMNNRALSNLEKQERLKKHY